MSKQEQTMPVTFADRTLVTIPPFNNIPEITLDISVIKQAEKRIQEAKFVNGATYTELEFTFNEAYREAKKHLSTIGYQKLLAKKELRRIRSELLIDEYPDWLKETKLKDSTATKEAFFNAHDEYVKAQDREDMLVALESLFEGKVKVFENVCRYMKKTMDLYIRSGIMQDNKYVSQD